jgi:dipeptidyl aminopeptidase/acylaminoacyl peptidase
LEDDVKKQMEEMKRFQIQMSQAFASIHKAIDNVAWFQRLGDIADVDMVTYVGPPPANQTAQSAQDRGNPLKIRAYVFAPKDAARDGKYPLLVYPHGGVHANFSSGGAHVVREMVTQGYLVIAPDYRGSTGYGEEFFNLIDYGGLEVEDVLAGREWMVENHPMVDPDRIGIMGWSHGGLITLMNIFRYPDKYKVAYAGVPVSDLVARMGYKHPHYHGIFAAPNHIGKFAYENPAEYRRRSPAWHADRLQTPLLVHTTTNDEDVNSLEVEHLIKSLKAAGKDFQYKIYQQAPGGHVFNRIDTALARESRREIWQFLAGYLDPPHPGRVEW